MARRSSMWLTALGLVACLASNASATSLLVNGSFEQGSADPNNTVAGYLPLAGGSTAITGWEVLGNPIEWIGYFWQASDGQNSVDLDGSLASGVRQTFATTPGQTYLVTFDLAGNPDNIPVIKPMRVSADGQSASFYFDDTGATHTDMMYVRQTFSFVADDSSATLEFRSLTDVAAENPGGVQGYGPVIDNVSAEAVPTPAALWLLLTGFAGVAATRQKQRRSARV
jgi:choice-of-anchor C domain-containing protein